MNRNICDNSVSERLYVTVFLFRITFLTPFERQLRIIYIYIYIYIYMVQENLFWIITYHIKYLTILNSLVKNSLKCN
jgi:hypothetical protein